MLALIVSGAFVPLGMDAASANVPSLSIGDVTVQEPHRTGATSTNPGSSPPLTVPAVFTVSLDQPAPAPVAVHFATVVPPDGDAYADIQSTSGWLTIDAGSQTAQITVRVNEDWFYEPTEYFRVELDQPSGAAIADGFGVGTILNSDRDGHFSCAATGFWYQGRSSANYDAYGQANTGYFNEPKFCYADYEHLAGWYENGTPHAFVPAAPDYLSFGAATLVGYTRTDPWNALRDSIPQVDDAGISLAEVVDGSVTTTSGFTLKFDSVRADATIRCTAVGSDPPVPVLVGTSHLRGLTLGKYAHVYTSDYMKRPFGLDGQIEFNKQTVAPLADGMRLTQQAVVITYGTGATWVLGEAIVEYHGNPCRY